MYFFQKTYGGNDEDYTTDDLKTVNYFVRCHPLERASDNGFIMVGTTKSFGLSRQNIYVVKTKTDGAFQWSKTFGVSNVDVDGTDIKKTKDGGYVILGNCNYRSGGTDTKPAGTADILVLKTDATGNKQWVFKYGTGDADMGYSIQQTSDEGYIITGSSFSTSRKEDVYLLKLDKSGTLQWSKTYGGTNIDMGYYVRQTSDGGYIITGNTASFGSGTQVYLIKTDNTGSMQWSKTFGAASGYAGGTAVQQTSDGGYIVTGYRQIGELAVYLIKTTSNGTHQWSKTYASTLQEEELGGWDVQQIQSGGYVIAAYVNGAPHRQMAGLLKTNGSGTLIFASAYGGRSGGGVSGAFALQVTDGYAIGGHSNSLKNASTDFDLYLVKTDTNGNVPCYKEYLPISTGTWTDNASPSSTAGSTGAKSSVTLTTTTPATATHALCLIEVQFTGFINLGVDRGYYAGRVIVPPDDGREPYMATAHLWKSEAIWLRTSQDNVIGPRAVGSFYEHETQHQNPVFNGNPNYVYVMVDNLSGETSSEATLKVYWSKSAANMGWQAHWVNDVNPLDGHLYGDLVGSVTIPSLPPGENYVAELPWTPPNPTQYGETQSTYSFLARIESAEDPMSFTETSNTEQNTRNNDNIAWRNVVNVSAAEMQAGDPGHVKHVIVRNTTAAPLTVGLALSVPVEEQGINPIISQGSVRVDLGGLYALWHTGGSIGTGVVDNGDGSVTVTSEDATIGGMLLQPGEEHTVHISFTYAGAGVYEDDPYTYDVVQQGGDDGGVGFELHFPVAADNGGGGEGGGGGDVTKPVAPGVTPGGQGAGGYRLTAQPNPSHGTVVISYHLPTSGAVHVGIYDLRGVLVRELVRQADESAGGHEVAWDGLDGNGRAAGSGVYLYRLETESGVISRRLQLLR